MAAEMWGAEWLPGPDGGRLRLPIVQGIRHGIVEGNLTLEASQGSSLLQFDVEEETYSINRAALGILILGALGGVSLILWPVSPVMLSLAPIGAVLALVAWLMVVSRLRHTEPGDFLDLVAKLVENP